MDAIDRVIAEMSPDDTVAALRLLRVLEESGQMHFTEAEAWRRQITEWARWRRGRYRVPIPRSDPAAHERGNGAIRLVVPVASDR